MQRRPLVGFRLILWRLVIQFSVSWIGSPAEQRLISDEGTVTDDANSAQAGTEAASPMAAGSSGTQVTTAAKPRLAARSALPARAALLPITNGVQQEFRKITQRAAAWKADVSTLNRWLIALVCVGAFLLSGFNFMWRQNQVFEVPYSAINWMLLGVALLPLAIWLVNPPVETLTITRERTTRSQFSGRKIIGLLLGLILLFIMAEANRRRYYFDFRLNVHLQMALFIAGIFAVVWALGGFSGITLARVRQVLMQHVALGKLPWLWIGAIALCMVVGYAARTWRLEDAVHIMIDEQPFFDGAVRLRDTPDYGILEPLPQGMARFPHLFSYFEMITVNLFGANFAGVRMASALFGVLTIPAIFFVGSALLDRYVGLIAAAIIAIFPPHIAFSRLAMNNIADPLFGVLMFGFLGLALRHNRVRDYVWAGAFLGLTGYWYEGGRLLFPAVVAGWLLLILVLRRPFSHWRGMVLMVIAAVAVAAPYYYAYAQDGVYTFPRASTEAVRWGYMLRDMETMPVWDVLRAHWDDALSWTIYHTVYSIDRSYFYYGGSTAIFHWYVVPFYLLGAFFALFRLRWVGVMLWAWIIAGLLGISLVVSTDWTVRYVVLFPAMVLLAAIGVRYAVLLLWLPRLNTRWMAVPVSALLAIFAFVGLQHYFTQHLPLYNEQVRPRYDFYDAFYRATLLPDVEHVYYLTDEIVFEPVLDTTNALEKRLIKYEVWNPNDVSTDRLSALPHNQRLVFFLKPDDAQSLNMLRMAFPGLDGPQFSPVDTVPLKAQYAMYTAVP